MKYTPTHKREVRGSRIHETAEERFSKQKCEEFAVELLVGSVKTEFLVPTVQNFVETEHVKKLKDRVQLWVKAGCPPHIVGPTGCGKTTLAMEVAKELGKPTVWINGDEQMTTTDLIGGYSEMEAESLRDKYIHNVMKARDRTKFSWVDNPLTLACKYGYTLVYNEFSRSKPEANNVLLSVLEEKILELPTMFGDKRYLKVHPDFAIILTSNCIEYAGIHKPQDALLDRMIDIYMGYYDYDTELKIAQAHTHLPLGEIEKVVKAVRTIRDKMPDPYKPGTRAEIMICQGLNALGRNRSKENIEQIYMDVLGTKMGDQRELMKKSDLIRTVIKEAHGDPKIANA
jgi:nitric oxide reductase NorQ protein